MTYKRSHSHLYLVYIFSNLCPILPSMKTIYIYSIYIYISPLFPLCDQNWSDFSCKVKQVPNPAVNLRFTHNLKLTRSKNWVTTFELNWDFVVVGRRCMAPQTVEPLGAVLPKSWKHCPVLFGLTVGSSVNNVWGWGFESHRYSWFFFTPSCSSCLTRVCFVLDPAWIIVLH